MTWQERIDAYARAFPDRPPLQLVHEGEGAARREVVYGQWVCGQDYRNKSGFYGPYPPTYMDRVMTLFPDITPWSGSLLHVFSGSLPDGPYARCDIRQTAEFQCSVYDLPAEAAKGPTRWELILADPPYSSADAEKYGTAMVHRGRAMAALAQVARVGGHLVWLDTVWPMHRKDQWRTVGRIGLTRSTNHRVRMVSIFERVAA